VEVRLFLLKKEGQPVRREGWNRLLAAVQGKKGISKEDHQLHRDYTRKKKKPSVPKREKKRAVLLIPGKKLITKRGGGESVREGPILKGRVYFDREENEPELVLVQEKETCCGKGKKGCLDHCNKKGICREQQSSNICRKTNKRSRRKGGE